MSDALSRLPNLTNKAELELDMRVDEVSFNMINFSPPQNKIANVTRRETQLSDVVCVIRSRLPGMAGEDARSTA